MSEQKPQTSTAEDDVFFVSLQYRGTAYEVPVQTDDHVATIFDFVQEALDFPRENCKLISRGKMIRPDHDELTIGDAKLAAGSKLMLVASSAHDVSFVKSSRADPLVKGFAEEERDDKARAKRAKAAMASAWGTKQDAEYNFGSIKAEFKYSTPPPYEAEALLKKLATDPGIIDIMTSRKFKVGVFTEMSPTEAQERMANRGTPNMDLLGYNQNAGGMIVLRLRTDSLKGFRPYHDLINTLIHELTHNVWGPHDHNFWKLFGELKAQYMRFHRFWSHGGQTADGSAGGQFQGFATGDEDGEPGSFGRTLGGAGSAVGDPRKLAALAAEERLKESAKKESPEPPEFVRNLGLPNFLAGNGSWMILCPCGQTHDVASLCDVGVAASKPAGGAAPSLDSPSGQDVPMEDSREEQPPQRPADSEPVTSSAAQSALDSAEPSANSAFTEQAPASIDAGGSVPPEAAVRMEVEVDNGPPLDLADLTEQGLDGAALWLQRFEAELRSLHGGQPGRPEAREAVSLLSRLVQNIVDSPHEPKYRRVRAENPKIRAKLLGAGAAAEALMVLLGFESVTEDGERVFVIRDATLDSAKLRMGQELLQRELSSTSESLAAR